ncbi:glycoside hydrolase superfamily [Halteromyces radiatus]|uniref:glycoside hydrolase superfamily n=1 Tax=Halteromyces radiatus TaxID=101107 RepID=UPI00222024AD|nr:glycoside hydrolase superfamily [Halteromyces radiatus]KAI8080047.1 glycoside hydrolase superfamily [Halteromyces radiatus]
MPKQWHLDIFRNENIQYFALAFYWYSYQPVTVTLVPYFVFSIFHAFGYIRSTIIPVLFPADQNPWIAQLCDTIKSYTDQYHETAMQISAYVEVMIVIPRLLLGVLLFRTSILALIIFSHFLRLRYYLSPHTQQAVFQSTLFLDHWLLPPTKDPRIPPWLSKLYFNLRAMIVRYASATGSVTSSCILLLLGSSLTSFAINPAEWYKANPGMAKIGPVKNHQITDIHGRVRFFHGTNVVKKEAPWYRSFDFKPGDSFGLQDVQNLQRLGINAVRLGHHWAGSEPVRGQYNTTFLDIMKQQTQLANDHGIYILVDVHQDVLAQQFCGHGVPSWFVKTDWVPSYKRFPVPQKLTPFTTNDQGIPSSSDCSSLEWDLSYLTVAVANAFGRLYNNYDGLGDAFALYWKQLASQYVDTPNILGYNLLNEPWVGDQWADPTLLVPGVADHKTMEALWNRAATQIRNVDNNTLIWFEGSTFDIKSGFNNVPLGDGSKTVQSFHYYRPPQIGAITTTLANRADDSKRLNTAAVMTEFTMWMGDQSQMDGIQTAVNAADDYMVSWMGWAYENLYDANGTMYAALAKHYSRAYPQAISGTPDKFTFNTTDSSFSLVFHADPTIDAPTELILPKDTFPNGYNVSFTPADALVPYALDDQRTLALFTQPSIQSGQAISISITKK